MKCLAVVLLVACGSPRHTMTADESFRDKAQLVVELARSPTGGATFDFCPAPAVADPHLGNAAWLAFLSANEYSHLFYLSTMLKDLGFGTGGGLDWPTCATDVRVMRGFEDTHRDVLVAASHAKSLKTFLEPHAATWGACAKAWFAKHYDGTQFPAAAFEKYLIHTAHEGEYVEFFSGGQIEHAGRVFASGSTQVTVARHRTLPLVIIAFRGTEPNRWSDIVTDLKVWKTPYATDWGQVHAGFHKAFESVGGLLRAKLEEYKGEKLAIWITGHSLGGALAQLLAAEIFRRNEGGAHIDLRGVYTFGSPRVGDRAFRTQLADSAVRNNTQMVRFRNGNDVVTALPRVMDFEHAGRVVHLHDDKVEVADHDPPYGGVSVADHDIAGWVRPKKAVSGYYRRILAGSVAKPSACPKSEPLQERP